MRAGHTFLMESAKRLGDYVYVLDASSGHSVGESIRMYASADLYDGISSDTLGLQQLINVSNLPGVFGPVVALPDFHSGYGFPVGCVAAFDYDDEKALVCAGGIGYDIYCGVRMLGTNLSVEDVSEEALERVVKKIFERIPIGAGDGGVEVLWNQKEIDEILVNGMDWALKRGYATEEDKVVCENQGVIPGVNPKHVWQRAKQRGYAQLGSVGSGNHYIEIQKVEEIYDQDISEKMGVWKSGQICIMIHCGSRGLGHQIATDAISRMGAVTTVRGIETSDAQLASAVIHTERGQKYLNDMSAAANYAYCNRTVLAYYVRMAFLDVFGDWLEVRTISDVSHNGAWVERHVVNGVEKRLVIHRKGASKVLPPGHFDLPTKYSDCGTLVPVGGSMGTNSYVLAAGENSGQALYSICHGAGRVMSRSDSKSRERSMELTSEMKKRGIVLYTKSPHMISTEAPEVYKDIHKVVDCCVGANIGKRVLKLSPMGVIKE